MKNFKFLALLAFSAVPFISSCTKVLSSDFDPDKGEKYAVKVRVVHPSTKAADINTSQDLTVHSLQVYAFLNGDLDVYRESQCDTLILSCTQGTRKFYALINAPTLNTITTEAELLAATSDLANSRLNSLEMIGSQEATIGKDNKVVEIHVSRVASRIVLEQITKAFTSTALAKQTFKVKRIYLVNASGKAAYGDLGTPKLWCNQKAFDESLDAKYKKFMIDTVDFAVSTDYSVVHTFYCYPNGTESDVNGGSSFSARYTRLVIEAEIGKELCYYPINLPKLENNKSYVIKEVKITKPGSTSPDEPVTVMNCEVSLYIEPWDSVNVTEGTTV